MQGRRRRGGGVGVVAACSEIAGAEGEEDKAECSEAERCHPKTVD